MNSLKSLLLFASCALLASCVNGNLDDDSTQETLQFTTDKITFSYNEETRDTKIKASVAFDIETETGCDWIATELVNDILYIDADYNPLSKVRSCHLIIKNKPHHLSDTLTVTQKGCPPPEDETNSDMNDDESSGESNTGDNSGNSSEGGSDINDGGSDTNATQCAAITQKGTRCKRKAAEGSTYCWQHP